MSRDEIKQTIDDFLTLLEKGCGSEEENESQLMFLLDKLAFAQHFVKFEYDDTDYPDAPRKDHIELMSLAGIRFPVCKGDYYNALDATKDVGIKDPQVGIRMAQDDIADIARDLYEAKWRWENNSPENGLWYFTFSYESHWADHLRGLQRYLIELKHSA
ncbi:MAG: DUF5063 domain-containing protein [Verrucomicrobia bacterium]|nr:DUF5063 domain-containing protein [Verrucomicrobiota bacterium]